MLVTIVDQSRAARVRSFYGERGVGAVFSASGTGTASSAVLDYFGLGRSEKSLLFSLLWEDQAKGLIKSLNNKFRLYIPGRGIAFTVKLSSFAGATAMKYLLGPETSLREEVSMDKAQENQNNAGKYHLIVAIANRGYSDQVMAAARSAHARGGTVVHATGTGSGSAESFFGVNINPDKDMLFIVSTAAAKDEIIKAIVAQVGVSTQAHAIVFSVPVQDLAGIRVDGE